MLALGSILAASSALASDLPAGFVRLSEVAPGIRQDIKYAGADNFVGRRLDGYEVGECILTEVAAKALTAADKALKANGYGLTVHDCYRPERAVADIRRWAATDDIAMKARFYPDIEKSDFDRLGYVAWTSSHSRGSAVDLSLTDGDGRPLDMGTEFDFFGDRSRTDSDDIPQHAKANRRILVDAMEAAGFRNYQKEWWHFGFRNEPFPDTNFDFVVRD